MGITKLSHCRRWAIALVGAVACCAAPAWAVKVIRIQAEHPAKEFARCLSEGDVARATELMDELLRNVPRDPAVLYNAACLETRKLNLDAAARHLLNAVKAGFADFSHMRRDADLAMLRDHSTYQAILRARAAADEILIARALDGWRARVERDRYRVGAFDDLRVYFAAAVDAPAINALHATIARESAFLESHLFGPLERCSLLVIIPAESDATALLTDAHAGGCYHHNLRRLVARDLGPSLKHELVHALHHRHMDQLGQQHPMWIQEGLATLFETCRFSADGSATLEDNERLNLARHLARSRSLTPWRTMARLPQAEFNRRTAAHYAQVWSIMRFIDDRGLLAAWYSVYISSHVLDPTGMAALETAFHQPIEELEREWLAWLESQPAVIGIEREL